VVAAVVGLVPAVIEAGDSLGPPGDRLAEPLSFLANPRHRRRLRVLWLGDPRAVPLGGWSNHEGPRVCHHRERDAGGRQHLGTCRSGPVTQLASAVTLPRVTDPHLAGSSPLAVAYVVWSTPRTHPRRAPDDDRYRPRGAARVLLARATCARSRWRGYTVFANTEYLPERAQARRGAGRTVGLWPRADVRLVARLRRHLGGDQLLGPRRAGPWSHSPPRRRWHLDVAGRTVKQSTAFGWAAQFAVAPAGSATLSFDGGLGAARVGLEMLAWSACLAPSPAVARWLDW